MTGQSRDPQQYVFWIDWPDIERLWWEPPAPSGAPQPKVPDKRNSVLMRTVQEVLWAENLDFFPALEDPGRAVCCIGLRGVKMRICGVKTDLNLELDEAGATAEMLRGLRLIRGEKSMLFKKKEKQNAEAGIR